MELKSFSVKSDQGPFLNNNEDGYEFDLNKELFMVFDGFGGQGVGDVVVNELKTGIKKFYGSLTNDPDATLPFFYSPRLLLEANALVNAILSSHKILFNKNSQMKPSQRGGASSVLICKTQSILNILSVGNVAAYLYRRGRLIKVFVEDSAAMLSSDDYNAHLKTIPMNALGLYPDLYYQLKEVRVFEDDLLLFLTDGVYSRLIESETRDIMASHYTNQEKIDKLFNLSNSRGNIDNQTALILQF